MGKHAKPTRGVLIARTGACGGAALALSAVGLFAPVPAMADGTPPGEVVSASEAEPAQKATKENKANGATKANKVGKAKKAKKANRAKTDEVGSRSVDPENGFEQSIEQDAEDASRNVNGLANLAGNNVQLIAQACNNFVPVNGVGGQVAGEELTGALGVLGDDTEVDNAGNSKDCAQGSEQDDADDTGDGDRNTNGLVNVSDNNVQVPLQGCNNYVPVNGVGGQVTGEEVTGALGLLASDTRAGSSSSKGCDQESGQEDDD